MTIALALVTTVAAQAQDELTGYTGTVTLEGAITGANSAEIRVYSNGLLAVGGESDVTGRYMLEFDVSGSRDETVVVWFLPSEEGLVPELLVLKESSEARRNQIWAPCIPRAKAGASVGHDVVFQSERNLLKSLAKSDCWER